MHANVNELELVRASVESANFFAHVKSTKEMGEQLVCVSSYSNGIFHGTSCWVAFIHGCWILGSFGYRRWLVLNRDDLVRSAIEWLSSGSGPGAPPPATINGCMLRELTDAEFRGFLAHGPQFE